MTKGRFAPSPSGRMHLGNVYAALLSWLSARSQEGDWFLRIEDIDPQRSRKEYADQIRDDLRWLGLEWDEECTQSERFHLYEEHLNRLQSLGVTYPCYCTRADILATQAPHESDGRVVYKGTCRNLPPEKLREKEGEAAAIRLIVPDKDITFCDGHYGEQVVNLARNCGDFILRRKDGAWAYQLAVVVDDALNGITEVVRGRDLLLSVPQQTYLFSLFGYEQPSYTHIPLLVNAAGQRLSKRDKSLELSALRSKYTAEEIIGMLAYHAGITDSPAPSKAHELINKFSWDKVPKNDITIEMC